MAVLEVKELTKKYGEGESEVIALDHVSLLIPSLLKQPLHFSFFKYHPSNAK